MIYLEGRRMTQAQFSPIVGISTQQINNVVKGRSRMSLKSALRVVTASGGEISLADIANWEPPRRKRKAVRAKR